MTRHRIAAVAFLQQLGVLVWSHRKKPLKSCPGACSVDRRQVLRLVLEKVQLKLHLFGCRKHLRRLTHLVNVLLRLPDQPRVLAQPPRVARAAGGRTETSLRREVLTWSQHPRACGENDNHR